MIDEINIRLMQWARWACRAHDLGLGYPSCAVGAQYVKSNVVLDPSYHPSVPVDVIEAEETERAVNALSAELREAVTLHYLEIGSVGYKAKRLHLSRPAYYRRIEWAQLKISEYLAALYAVGRKGEIFHRWY